jgi:hypothetical protein
MIWLMYAVTAGDPVGAAWLFARGSLVISATGLDIASLLFPSSVVK